MIQRLLHFVLDKEPVSTSVGAGGIIGGILGVLVDDAELAAAIGVVISAIVGWFARRRAWSPASVEKLRGAG